MELNQENYETYLLLYIDNELTAPERAAVEAFLATNPTYSQELKALQNAILAPEAILYNDKSMLYKYEEMNASLDPTFKQSLYKKTTSNARLIEFKKIYIAYAAIAAVAIWMIFGTSQIFKPTTLPVASIEDKLATVSPPIFNSKKNATPIPSVSMIKYTKNSSTANKLGHQARPIENTLSISTNTTIVAPETIAQNQTTIPQVTEASISVQHTSENNSSIVAETKVEKESFEAINIEDNDRVIYISNIELDGDKFRGVTRRLSAIFKRNKTEKNK